MSYTKSEMNQMGREMGIVFASYNGVGQQMSKHRGKITIGKGKKAKKLTIHEAMIARGVHTKGNSYTAWDINMAWSERLKEGEPMYSNAPIDGNNKWRCPLIMKSVAMTVTVCDTEYKLFNVNEDGEMRPVKVKALCRLVNAKDKRKGSTDVVVDYKWVLKGLQQSVFVDDTLTELKASQKEAEEIDFGYVNIGEDSEEYVDVVKIDGKWYFVNDNNAIESVSEEAEAEVNVLTLTAVEPAETAKKSLTRKNTRKSSRKTVKA